MDEDLDGGVEWVMISIHEIEPDLVSMFEIDPAALHVLHFLDPLQVV